LNLLQFASLFLQDRILATCRENALDYVQDPTNFQPELTIRNAIRQKIAQKTPIQFPDDVTHVLRTIHQAATNSQLGFDLDSSLEDLREANQKIVSKVRQKEDSGQYVFPKANRRLTFWFQLTR
jgi:tRNA(Ile)-lysidine synthase TilS/MesJ